MTVTAAAAAAAPAPAAQPTTIDLLDSNDDVATAPVNTITANAQPDPSPLTANTSASLRTSEYFWNLDQDEFNKDPGKIVTELRQCDIRKRPERKAEIEEESLILSRVMNFALDLPETINVTNDNLQSKILLPYQIFLEIELEKSDQCNLVSGIVPSWEFDWKTKPRYGHHLDSEDTSSSESSSNSMRVHHGVFAASYYGHHKYTDDDRGTLLHWDIISKCVLHCTRYLTDRRLVENRLVVEQLWEWLRCLCSHVDYVCYMRDREVLMILDVVRWKISPLFEMNEHSVCCLSALVYNLTTRLGMGMQIYTQRVIEIVGVWAEGAWKNKGDVGQSEKDIIAMPYLYSAVTHLLAAHPEQSIVVLSEHGHALLRLAQKYYTKVSADQDVDALTDYIGAHLLVAETSGRLCGLPEGDLGPLEPRDEEDDSPYSDEDQEEKDFEAEEGPTSRKKQRKKKSGATLDGETILSLLDMIRNEKVWEAMFSSGDDGSKKRRKKSSRRSFPGGKKGITGGKKSPLVSEGGATWTPLNRRQRRYLELLARLIRVSQRLHLSKAEDVKEGSIDLLELLIKQANDLRDQPSIEKGEIDIERDDDNSQPSVIATPDSLACSPWIRMVCRHLYNLNPKLGKMVQSGVNASLDNEMNSSQFFTQHHSPSERSSMEGKDGMALMERLLFESCPILQALTVETAEETSLAKPTSTYAASTFTRSNSFLFNDKGFKGQDSVHPTATATLQLLCASAESFPRGECWTSSARNFWSTVLDDRQYPNGISANVLERYGSSPADAAAVIYLLGTTLESFGGAGGDESVQLWTLMALLKMTESSAIICSREGLDCTSFGSPSALGVLCVAWQYVWKVLFRYDLRYVAYTQGAYDSNAGELVLQLLTQMIRYNCADRMTMFSRKSSSLSGKEPATSLSPFVHAEQGHVYKLPIFDDTSTILSSAPFELITAIIEHVGFSGVVRSNNSDFGTKSPRDLTNFLSLCLNFLKTSMMDEPQSHIQRSFFPFVSMCLASLLSNGGVATSTSSYELDGLTRFGITEDVEPTFYSYNPDRLDFESTSSFHWLLDDLWADSIGYDRVEDKVAGLSRRILQGRGALLNKFLDASYDRDKLQTGGWESNGDSSHSASTLQLGSTAMKEIKALFDEKILEVEKDAVIRGNKPLVLPQLTSYLSFILTAIISKNLSSQTIAKDIAEVFKDMFMPAFEVIVGSLPSLACHAADRVAVLNHLNGIVRVLVKISAVEGNGECSIRLLLQKHASKKLYSLCETMLQNHWNQKCTSSSPIQSNINPCVAVESNGSTHTYIDAQTALSCASLMVLLQPDLECLEFIAGCLDKDPHCAMVCVSLFCQKSVVLRREGDEGLWSVLIFLILRAMDRSTPSSKYFMWGLGITASLVEIREYSNCCCPINPEESKEILKVLQYPEGIEKNSENYHRMREWKRILKLKSSYNAEKLRCTTVTFLFANKNLHKTLDEFFCTHIVKASIRNADENIRELAPDAVGAALDSLPDDEVLKLVDDAEGSFDYHYIECIGLMAGASKDASISRDMIWKLIDLAHGSPALSLLCLRALKRASFLLGYKKLNDLLDETMPHLLVKWLKTKRRLQDMPLLLTSPFAMEMTCRYFPVDVSSMLLQKDGWDDGYFTTLETLKERLLYSFVQAVTDFLIPSILLSASEDDDSMKYLSECAVILTDAVSDESIATVLRREIAAICGYIFIFNDSLPNESYSAMKMFQGCVLQKLIKEEGAKNAHRVLRHMLVLRRKGVSVDGSPALELDSKTFIDGMKMISKQFQRTSRNGEKASFLEYAGSSMTECVVIAKYWLSSSLTIRQREDSWGVFELLCTILKETLHDETISYSEIGFTLNAFVTVMLDQNNSKLLPSILDSLKGVLESLYESPKTDLVEGVLPTLQKLCLALLQVHERTFLSFSSKCNSSLASLEFEQRSSKGLLEDWDDLNERDKLLEHVIRSKVAVETTYHETLIRSFESVAMMARSGKMLLKDVLGAQDMALQLESGHNRDLFSEVNPKYSMASLFSSIQQEDSDEIPSLHDEFQYFLQIMKEYPISVDPFRAGLSTSSTAVLQSIEAQARLLALRRLEKSLVRHDSTQSPSTLKLLVEVCNWLMKICYSLDPEESRLLSSRCLGEMNSLRNITTLTMPAQSKPHGLDNVDLIMQTEILSSVCGFLVSDCAETSLVAMETAKAFLNSNERQISQLMNMSEEDKALLMSLKDKYKGQQHTSVLISDSCTKKLKAGVTGIGDGDFWCFSEELWNLNQNSEGSPELWIKNIVCAIIRCCFGEDSKVPNRYFFYICQGMCAKEASFAAKMFPYLIFSLLDAARAEKKIGSKTIDMNALISERFSSSLKLNAEQMKTCSQAITAILNSLDWLKKVKDHRVNNEKEVFHGVILRLDGIDVAKACFHAKRYFSAMYYAEMGMQNMLGSSSFLEKLSGDYAHELDLRKGCIDISGSGVSSQVEYQHFLERALFAADIIARCLTELDANDELNGVLSQGAALSVKQNILSLPTLGGGLQKWFEDSLNTASQWDDSLLPRLNESDQFVQSDQMRDALPLWTNAPIGFDESVNHALLSLENGDMVGGLSNVTQARKSILADMEALVGSEYQLKGMATHLSRLSVIGNLELTARTLEGKGHVNFLLHRWGLCNEAHRLCNEAVVKKLQSLLLESDNYSFDMKDHDTDVDNILAHRVFTEFSVKEKQLNLLISKFELDEKMGNDIAEALTSHVFKSSHIYRDLGRTDDAINSLIRLSSLVQGFQQRGMMTHPPILPLVLRLEEAKLMKCQNDLDNAIRRCKIISSHLDSIEDGETNMELNSVHADSLLLGSLWMAEQNADAATTILSSFQKAADLSMKVYKEAKELDTSHSCIQKASIAGFKLGEFAATLYYSLDKRMSHEWEKRCLAASERKKDVDFARNKEQTNQSAKDSSNPMLITMEREASTDDTEMTSMKSSLMGYLQMSVTSYCSALKLCPPAIAADVSSHVFQLVSMWFKNCTRAETKDIVNGLMQENAKDIPSYRFVPLAYQLFSRMDRRETGFQEILYEMVHKICKEHPYHGIIQLVALANGRSIGDDRNGEEYLGNVGTSKIDAANYILSLLRKETNYISQLVKSYVDLSKAYIALARRSNEGMSKMADGNFSLAEILEFQNWQGSKCVCPPVIFTKPPLIRPDMKYGDGENDPIGAERVYKFDEKGSFATQGKNPPKIVVCRGTNGGTFTQLVKGRVDLRQDAIVEQVFGTVNDLLRRRGGAGRNIATKQSQKVSAIPYSSPHLRLITYGVTPLTPSCGVLEWVDDSTPLLDSILSLHKKCNNDDWNHEKCMNHMRQYATSSNDSRRQAYNNICTNFSPVFRFFFLRFFGSSPEAWHTARTAYTRSCAVNSIVGHILGIGDRHCSNILVDTRTGEVVHIDFDILFEQGKNLTVPELVPFRLTREIVDGMGPSGTDGVFVKAAEATLGVLRNNTDTLLTILSAVVSDPLYKWSTSPRKERLLQQEQNSKEEEDGDDECKSKEQPSRPSLMTYHAEDDENRNDGAVRAIFKITNKLQGYEDSLSLHIHNSVESQVKLLIKEARDPGNLSLMYYGWKPWL